MKKLIFGEPICKQDECCHNDPGFPNNCRIISDVDACCMADVCYPNYLQKALVWLKKYGIKTLIILAVCAVFSFLVIHAWITTPSSRNNRIYSEGLEYLHKMKAEQSTPIAKRKFKQLWVKHGRPPVVIYEPGKTPYYTNKEGQKCKFT